MMKIKIVIILFVVVAIWGLSFLIHLYELKGNFKLENIDFKMISSITISNRGMKGINYVSINKKDSIDFFDRILAGSVPVNKDDLNLRDNDGLCEIEINFKDKKSMEIDLTDTHTNSGIITSGDYFYRNDKLLNYIIVILKGE